MAQDYEQLVRRLEMAERERPKSSKADNGANGEISKRLRKREHECQALWECLKEMSTQFDRDLMMDVFATRQLREKAIRKLA